ncbi:MAG: hypothetical protein V3S29_02100 [bacterium]
MEEKTTGGGRAGRPFQKKKDCDDHHLFDVSLTLGLANEARSGGESGCF